MLIEIACEMCGKKFFKKSSEIKRTKSNCCSYECSYLLRTKVVKKVCSFCNKTFIKKRSDQIFCSHSCAASFSNIKRNRVRIGYSISCKNCNMNFDTNRKFQVFCSQKCSTEYKKNEKIIRFLNGELTDSQVRKETIREYLIKLQSGKCIICNQPPFYNGKPLVFIVDHIDGNFGNNNPENIRAICPNCNSQTDTFSGKNVGINKEKRHKKRYRK